MKSSTGQKRRSRLQGHRKRRRTFEVRNLPTEEVDWTEYKTLRQYQSMGDMLDEFKVYGFRAGVENLINGDEKENELYNGYCWLTEEIRNK